MKSDWFVIPASLSRARLQQLLGQEQLADKAGISLRSIQGYERREQRVRLESLQCIAKALKVEVSAIATVRTGADRTRAKPSTAPPPAVAAAPPPLLPRTQLETLVDLERDAGITPFYADTPRGRVERLTAKRLQDVLTAYALHEGARFSLTGKVDGMRGIAQAEAKLIGSRNGVAARFHIVKDVVPGQPVGVTIHSARKEHTALLQQTYGKAVTVHLRVLLAPGEPTEDGPGFTSFITRLTVKRPWTFVVEEVEEAEEAPPVARVNAKNSKNAKKSAGR